MLKWKHRKAPKEAKRELEDGVGLGSLTGGSGSGSGSTSVTVERGEGSGMLTGSRGRAGERQGAATGTPSRDE